MIPWWALLLTGILALIIGIFLGFYITRKGIQGQLQKNPPVNEKMIRVMFEQMGRKPSESQVHQVMQSMKKSNRKK